MVILIVKLGAIGDVLRTTFVLPGLKEKYPGVKIDWLTASSARDILLNNPMIDQLFVWEEREAIGRYDLVVGLEDEPAVCKFVSSVKSEKVLGAYWSKEKIVYTPSAWFDMSMISKYGLEWANELKKRNRKTFQQHLAELLDIRISHYVYNLLPEEIEYGEKSVRGLGFEKNEKIFGINTGAGKRWPQKSWGIEQTIELIKKIKKELGLPSLILGGEQEQERNAVIAKETGMPQAGTHPLRLFSSILNQCSALVSSDSLAMHFAIALKKKLVVLFGPTSAAEIELYGLGEKLFPPMDCLSCYRKNCDKAPNCMDLLSVEEVFGGIKRRLLG